MKETIFSDEKINTGRQIDLDLAKAISIVSMVFVHCLLFSMYFNFQHSDIYSHGLNDLLGGPMCAPLFMFCMGVGLVYSRRSQSELMIKRGISLLILGVLVNIGEFIIPHFLLGYLFNDWTSLPIFGGLLLFAVDILAFAGLSFIAFGIFKRLGLSNRQMLLIAVVLSVIGSFVRMVDVNNDVLNLVLGYFIGTDEWFTTFPFFNWFIFPISGYVWGQYYIRAYKDKFFKYWPIFLIIPIIYFIITIYTPDTFLIDDAHYYYMTLIDAIFCLLVIHGIMGFCYFISDKLPKVVLDIAGTLSRYINGIYIAQWFFIPIIMTLIAYLIEDIVFEDLNLIVISTFILILSTLAAIGNRKIRRI